MAAWQRIWERWCGGVGFDPHCLAVFRIALGGLLLLDLLSRLQSFSAHYTDLGVLPLVAVSDYASGRALVPFQMLHSGAVWQGGLFVLALALALALTVGYRTRLASIGCWLVISAIQARNPLVLYGADRLLMAVLLWACFLPLGAAWSLDARGGPRSQGSVQGVAVLAYILQISVVYFFSFLSKSGDAWWQGEAVAMVLELDAYRSSAGAWLAGYPGVLRFLNAFTLVVEGVAPFLLLWPMAKVRWVGAALLVCLQLGFAIFMELGFFPWVSLVALIPLFSPGRFTAGIPSWKPAQRIGGIAPRLVGVLMVVMLLWNTVLVSHAFQKTRLKGRLPDALVWAIEAVRLDQSWSMFSPDPPIEDGWLIFEAELEDSNQVNLLLPDQPLTRDRPESVTASLRSDRWKAYLLTIQQRRLSWSAAVDYFVQEWNQKHPDRRIGPWVRVVFLQDMDSPDGTERIEPVVLYERKDP